MNRKIAHLEMIQGVISRLSTNSFVIKGWNVTIIVALLVFLKDSDRLHLLVIGVFTSIAFWVLDAFFLTQENAYRALYEQVSQKKPDDIDFSMKTSLMGEMPNFFTPPYRDALLSATLMWFYIFLIILMIVVKAIA